MKKLSILVFLATFICISLVSSQELQKLTQEQERSLRARYPQQWEFKIAEGTRLDSLKKVYDGRLHLITTERDLEDQSPYPLWFRALLRAQFPEIPKSGLYQYPRVAAQILEWMISHPDLRASPPSDLRTKSMDIEPSRMAIVGTNINISNLDERNSESFISVDYSNPQYLIGASNNISGSGRQKQFYSSDGGATWSTTELPLNQGAQFQADPAVAWTTNGTAWTATLGIVAFPTDIRVQIYKSGDRGANWNFVATVSAGGFNDKELMWIDTYPTSPFKDNIYVAWDQPSNGMRFTRSTDNGATWDPVTNLSSDVAIGCHLTTGPSGELYVAWPDVSSQELRIRKSTDGGASFGLTKVIATTNDAFTISIPAFCDREALIYLSIGVDRAESPRKGWVYAVWTDRNGTAADPGCAGITSASNSNIYFSRSTDGGNTWLAPKIIHSNPAKTDQFNQWMDVDPEDGTIHVAYYDTRDDAGRKKAHIYYICSRDGGGTWINETQVTTAPTDETVPGADMGPFGNQYGDYNGLVAYRGVAHPVWTDRRSGVPGSKEQIFTAKLTKAAQQEFTYEYAAKIICGLQRDPKNMRLARGFYATAINIHNPNKSEVKFFKKLALTFPPEEQRPGKIIPIGEDILKPDEALEVDCMDIQKKLFPNGFPTPYIKGFVVIKSQASLDVIAVYTTASLDKKGRVTDHSSIDVEQIRERKSFSECADTYPNPEIKYDHTDAEGRVYIPVVNWSAYPNELFRQAPELPPCGANTNSSRTWVDIYNADNDTRIYGFCALSSNEGLKGIWFKPSTSNGRVYIIINDRTCEKDYKSNTLSFSN